MYNMYHGYPVQDDKDAQYDVVVEPSHPEPEMIEAKEELENIQSYN